MVGVVVGMRRCWRARLGLWLWLWMVALLGVSVVVWGMFVANDGHGWLLGRWVLGWIWSLEELWQDTDISFVLFGMRSVASEVNDSTRV